MRFDWLRCRSAQLQFDIYWAPGHENFAKYFTKHHPPAHHIALCPIYLAPDKSSKLLSMQGCNKILSQRLGKKLPVTNSQSHTKQASQKPVQSLHKSPAHKLTRKPPGHNSNRILLQPLIPLPESKHQLQPAWPNTSTITKLLPLSHHIKWIQSPICHYNKQLCTAI